MKFTLLFLLFFGTFSFAQVEDRYTEEEIGVQAKFIKASQKKLIGKLDDAIKLYSSILESDPHNAVALHNLSQMYLVKKDKDNAIKFGEKALKKDPNNLWYKESLAEVFGEFEDFDQSAKLYSSLIDMDAKKESHYINAVKMYRKLSENGSVLNVFRSMEKNIGANDYTIQQIVGLHLDQENYKLAISKAGQLIELYPNDPDYLLLNAQLNADFGSEKEATKLYNQLLRLDPENSSALVYLARSNTSSDELGSIEGIISNASVDIDAKIKALIPYAQKITKDDPLKERLIELARSVTDMHPDEAKGYTILGDLYANSEQPEAAEEQYINALQHDKSVYEVWQQLMYIQYDIQKYEALKKSSEQAMDFYPNQSGPYVFNGLASVILGDSDDAKDMLAESQIIGTKDPFLMAQIQNLSAMVSGVENGEAIKQMSKEDLFMRGLKEDDPSIIQKLSNGIYLVKIKKGS